MANFSESGQSTSRPWKRQRKSRDDEESASQAREKRNMREWGCCDAEVISRAEEVEKQLQLVKETIESPSRTGVTFEVARVSPCNKKLPSGSHIKDITARTKQKIESCFQTDANIVSSGTLHALVKAVHLAYDNHYPLVLSPDMIWLCISQGLAIHINQNSEQLREKFVAHSGKKEITVRRDDFLKGLATNPWPEVFGEFSQKIKDEIGVNNYDLITPKFSTTGPMEKAVGDIVLMDAMQSFFSLKFVTRCGIPSITLEGTKEDWIAVREKAEQLEQYDLKWWTKELLPILDQFVKAANGKVDRKFWSDIYKLNDNSGGPYISGWLITLFPYCEHRKGMVKNKFLEKWDVSRMFSGLTTDAFTCGLARAPFVWDYLGDLYKMHFVGGFMAVSQDTKTLALRPELGWAVVEAADVTCG
ncbi:uncharacterized protein [Ptychodera flava]|uniref:uncharacterized protein n=1 Tax=Ptychodera flava TaxID=63121 RepID=UPI00396AA1B2